MRDHELDHFPADDLDRMIEEALGSERLLSAPINFHRAVDERIRIAALKDRQRARFRFWMLSLAASACGALFLAAVAIAVTNLQVIVTNGVSGGKGTLDYYLSALLGTSADAYSGTYTLVTSVLLAAVALGLGWIPVRRLIGANYKLNRGH